MERARLAHIHPDRTYHGMGAEGGHIKVESYGGGPTQRLNIQVLYLLENFDQHYGPHRFWWGYTGGSAHDTARAILCDALGKTDPVAVPKEIQQAFCQDVIAHLDDEFHLNRMALVRWTRGWCAEHGVEFGQEQATQGKERE